MRFLHGGTADPAVPCGAAAPICLQEAEKDRTHVRHDQDLLSGRDYLNGAANRVDLEFRQRQVDRGLFRLDA
jgi:hypothetical protein